MLWARRFFFFVPDCDDGLPLGGENIILVNVRSTCPTEWGQSAGTPRAIYLSAQILDLASWLALFPPAQPT